jgi:hypothetical protein
MLTRWDRQARAGFARAESGSLGCQPIGPALSLLSHSPPQHLRGPATQATLVAAGKNRLALRARGFVVWSLLGFPLLRENLGRFHGVASHSLVLRTGEMLRFALPTDRLAFSALRNTLTLNCCARPPVSHRSCQPLSRSVTNDAFPLGPSPCAARRLNAPVWLCSAGRSTGPERAQSWQPDWGRACLCGLNARVLAGALALARPG